MATKTFEWKREIIFLSLCLSSLFGYSQIGINNFNPDSSAVLDVTATDKGMLLPRMTEAQRNAIVSPANGLLLYQTNNSPGFYFNNGSSTTPSWRSLGWNYNGDSLFWDGGKVGIGTDQPRTLLHVVGTSSATTGLYSSLASFRDNTTTTGANPNYILSLARQNSNVEALYIGVDGNDASIFAGNNGDLRFGKDVSGTFTEYLRLQSSTGFFGVGTSSPSHPLHVVGDGQLFDLEGTTRSFMGFYPNGYAAGRKGYFGYVSVGNSHLSIVNTVSGSNVIINTTAGEVTSNSNINTSEKIQEDGNDLIPTGVIVMWSGSVASIPAGWALCNGSSGTPNLRDRFIVGAGSTYSPGNTGGSATSAHTHTVNPASVTTSTDGSHTHSFDTPSDVGTFSSAGNNSTSSGCISFNAVGCYTQVTIDPAAGTTGSDGSHSHSVNIPSTTSSAASNTENRPPYYALAFIMKL